MRAEIQLFIDDMELEFKSNPGLFFNYKISESTNPTVIKNSFSKSITVDGTPHNTQVFGNIWNLSRVQGENFNPLKKTPFKLYINGELFESGYCKLDNITTKNNSTQYNISLFGGLGEMFFSLSYGDEDGKKKKTLADLEYVVMDDNGNTTEVLDMSFRINKDVIYDAWSQIMGNSNAVYDAADVDRPSNYLYQNKWDAINFVPAYEGIPDDFECGSFLINSVGSDLVFDKNGYSTVNGFAFGEMDEELTCNDTRDYRSYLQRPAIRFKSIIDACCNPNNNNGWQLKLDETFFNKQNPYYEDTWLTLTMLRDNIEGGEIEARTDITLVPDGDKYYLLDVDMDTLSEFTNINVNLSITANDNDGNAYDKLYLDYYYDGSSQTAFSELCRYYTYTSAIICQLVGYDAVGSVVATSDVHYLSSERFAKLSPSISKFNSVWNDGVYVPNVKYHNGYFFRDIDGVYVWTDGDNKPMAINFKFTGDAAFDTVKLKLINPYYTTQKVANFFNPGKHIQSSISLNSPNLFGRAYWRGYYPETLSEAKAQGLTTNSTILYDLLENTNLIVRDYSGLFSDTLVKPEHYLTTDKTPCEYLTSYAKLFGLYFYRDPKEIADDEVKYPKGVIHLMTRKTYYDRINIVDFEDRIDRSKESKIIPQVAASKWITFNTEQNESEANNEYFNSYGYDYGLKEVNTGFEFNADSTEMLDNIAFMGGVEVLETNKYYTDIPHPYTYNGFTYQLYKSVNNELESYEISLPVRPIPIVPNSNGWDRTDAFPKMQFHTADNDPSDGNNVLVFFKGNSTPYEGSNGYWVTDDLAEMATLTDGSPCWIMTDSEEDINGDFIAYSLDALPMFGRNLIGQNGYITHSLDMGNPKMTFIRDTFVTNEMGIYSKCWDKYIEDMYDVNNRLITCYVRLDEKPTIEMLRKFYYFDGCLWRINAVKDWNPTVNESVKVEFTKVMDVTNYDLDTFNRNVKTTFTIPSLTPTRVEENRYYYEVGAEAISLISNIYVQNSGCWTFGDGPGAEIMVQYENGGYDMVSYSSIINGEDNGCGNANVVFNLPANELEEYKDWFLVLESEDNFYYCIIRQAAKVVKSISISPTSETVGSIASSSDFIITYKNREDDTLNISTPDWMTYGLVWNGNIGTLTLTYTRNDSFTRKGEVLLSNANVNGVIRILQQGALTPTMELSRTSVAFGKDGGQTSIGISTNATSVILTPSSNWITASLEGDAILITANVTNTTVELEGMVVVEGIFGDVKLYDAISVKVRPIIGEAYFGSSSMVTPTLNLNSNAGSTGIIPITKRNIKSQSFTINNSGFNVVDNGDSLTVSTKRNNSSGYVIRATITGTFIDINDNTITATCVVTQAKP